MKNTIINVFIIYGQRFFAAAIALITTPLFLRALGVEDFGIYTITIGFVGVLSVLNWSLASSSQRFIAVAVGRGEQTQLNVIFSTAFFVHLVYAVVFFLFIAILGLFFIENLLNIPVGKIDLAKKVMVIVGGVAFITILSIPFLGALRALENFKVLAAIGIFESLLKLFLAFALIQIQDDRLIYYAIGLLVISILSITGYGLHIYKYHENLRISVKYYSKKMIKEFFSFLSWSLLGAFAVMSRNEGVQYLLNIFFGVALNAAYGISAQISVAMSIMSQGVVSALSPKILKAAGANDRQHMLKLTADMSTFAIYSVSLVSLPFFFQCENILDLWLGDYPKYTVEFVRITVIFGQVTLVSAGIQTIFDGLGKVKTYNIAVSLILILNIPIAYIFLNNNYGPLTVIYTAISLEIIAFSVRLFLLKRYIDLNISQFLKSYIFNIFVPAAVMGFLLSFVVNSKLIPIWQIVLSLFSSFIIYPIAIYFLCFDFQQKQHIKNLLTSFFKK